MQNCFVIYRHLFLNFIASKNLKHLLYSNDLKIISNWLVLLSRCVRNLKPFSMNKNRSWVPQTHTRDYNKYLTNLIFSVRTVSYGSSFFQFFFSFFLCTINLRGKNSVCNLRYGPRTQLVRGMYLTYSHVSLALLFQRKIPWPYWCRWYCYRYEDLCWSGM